MREIFWGYIKILRTLKTYNILPFFFPIFPRSNFAQRKNIDRRNPTSPKQIFDDHERLILRSPLRYNQLSEYITEALGEFGEKTLGYNPITPIPKNIELAPDGVHLTPQSYQSVANLAAAYVVRIYESDRNSDRLNIRANLIEEYNRTSAGQGRTPRVTVVNRLFGLGSRSPPQ